MLSGLKQKDAHDNDYHLHEENFNHFMVLFVLTAVTLASFASCLH
jgi:hypothetical protein